MVFARSTETNLEISLVLFFLKKKSGKIITPKQSQYQILHIFVHFFYHSGFPMIV